MTAHFPKLVEDFAEDIAVLTPGEPTWRHGYKVPGDNIETPIRGAVVSLSAEELKAILEGVYKSGTHKLFVNGGVEEGDKIKWREQEFLVVQKTFDRTGPTEPEVGVQKFIIKKP